MAHRAFPPAVILSCFSLRAVAPHGSSDERIVSLYEAGGSSGGPSPLPCRRRIAGEAACQHVGRLHWRLPQRRYNRRRHPTKLTPQNTSNACAAACTCIEFLWVTRVASPPYQRLLARVSERFCLRVLSSSLPLLQQVVNRALQTSPVRRPMLLSVCRATAQNRQRWWLFWVLRALGSASGSRMGLNAGGVAVEIVPCVPDGSAVLAFSLVCRVFEVAFQQHGCSAWIPLMLTVTVDPDVFWLLGTTRECTTLRG